MCSISTTPVGTTSTSLPTSHTGIVDSGSIYIYISPESPFQNSNPDAPKVCVGMANVHIVQSSATSNLPIHQLIKAFPANGNIMSSLNHTLVGLGPIFYANFTVRFSQTDATVFSREKKSILAGWSDPTGSKLWRFALLLHTSSLPPKQADTQ